MKAAAPEVLEPEGLEQRVNALTARLLPDAQHYAEGPPLSWNKGVKPKNAISLDDEVSRLTSRPRPPRMRDKEVLKELGVLCPYWYARAGAICAAETAWLAFFDYQFNRRMKDQAKPELQDLAKDAKKLADGLSALTKAHGLPSDMRDITQWHPDLREYAQSQLAPKSMYNRFLGLGLGMLPKRMFRRFNWQLGDDENDYAAQKSLADLAPEMICALNTLASEFDAARKLFGNNPRDVFRLTFAIKIGNDFECLTGSKAATGDGPFLEYLTQAGAAAFDERRDWADIVRVVTDHLKAK